MAQRAIITGATSGIGYALALRLVKAGYLVGACGRRLDRLETLRVNAPERIKIMKVDVSETEILAQKLRTLTEKIGGLDLLVVNAGIGRTNRNLELAPELETIDINVRGFVATAILGANYFRRQGRGHLVGISSVAAHMGNATVPAYNASKAFELNYLHALYARLYNEGITVTDIRPGFVYTEMTENNERMFWVATAEKAADEIFKAIKKKKRYAYITKRYNLIALIMKSLPTPLFRRIASIQRKER